MMNFFRKGLFRFIFLVFLCFGAAGLVLMDWQGVAGNIVNQQELAVIEGEAISGTEFSRNLQRVLRAKNVSPVDAYNTGLTNALLQDYLKEHVWQRHAHDHGFVIPDEAVVKGLRVIVDQQRAMMPTLSRPDAARMTLEQLGMTETEFAAHYKRALAAQVGQRLYTAPEQASPELSALMNDAVGETRRFEFVRLDPAALPPPPEPDEATLRAFYTREIAQFTQPPSRSGVAAVITPDMITVNIPESDVQKLYADNKDRLGTPEKRALRQAVFATEAEAKNFLALSEDTRKSSKDWIAMPEATRDSLPEGLQDPVFAASATGLLPTPLQSDFGWHVVEVTSITKGEVPSFDSVRQELESHLKKQKLSGFYQEKVTLFDNALEEGESFQDAAAVAGMKLVSFDAVSRDNVPPELEKLGQAERISPVLWEAGIGEPTAIIELDNDSVAAFLINNETPSVAKDFESVRAEVRTLYLADARRAITEKMAAEFEADMRDNKITLQEIAGKLNAQVKTLTLAGKNADTGDVPQEARNTLWTVRVGTFDRVDLDNEILLVQRVKNPGTSTQVKNTSPLMPEIFKQDTVSTIVGYLSEDYNVMVNQRLFTQMFGPRENTNNEF